MKKDPQIAFRDIEPSEAVRDKILDRIDRLERYTDEIIGCRVVVETPHRHQHKGKLFHVSLDVSVPGENIVVNRDPQDEDRHEDVYAAINDAFDAAKRQLEKYSAKRRGEPERPEIEDVDRGQGTVSRLFPDEGYGFITPRLGTAHIYFHENAIVGAELEDLEEGDQVQFHEEEGDEGPQASTVHLLSRDETIPGN